jgi:Flp pilus assembly CpaF family ATPase
LARFSINSAQDVWIERLGQPEHTHIHFRDEDHVMMLIARIADHRWAGASTPKCRCSTVPCRTGSRVRAKVPPISPHGPTLSIEMTDGNPFEAVRRQQMDRQRSDAQPYAQLRERIQQKAGARTRP